MDHGESSLAVPQTERRDTNTSSMEKESPVNQDQHLPTLTSPSTPLSPHDLPSKGRQQKNLTKPVWLRAPLKEDGGLWVDPRHCASEWLSLYYDLVVVAVLTVFSAVHELEDPSRILPFFSYFLIIYWLWASQTHYDVRYQSDDVLHLCYKFFQICVFIFMGAASSNWLPGDLIDWSVETVDIDFSDEDIDLDSAIDLLSTSFKVVVWAYFASRLCLLVQYLICGLYGRRLGRRTSHFWITAGVLLFSIFLCLGAIFAPLHSTVAGAVKISLFYAAMGVEVVAFFVQSFYGRDTAAIREHAVERYAALTLIILGEGFISLTKVFKRALDALSTRDGSTYAQIFLAALILFNIWGFLFNRFSKSDRVSTRRQHIWELVHFPLAFGLLLLTGALTNTVLNIAATNALDAVSNIYFSVVGDDGSLNITNVPKESVWRYMDRLDLDPPFASEIALLQEMDSQTNATDNSTIEFVKYFGQILYLTFEKYEIELQPDALHEFETLQSIPSAQEANMTQSDINLVSAVSAVRHMTQETVEHTMSGTLWLFPAAGGVLLLTTIRSMIWNRYRGIGHWIVHGLGLAGGVSLCLLGLLALGHKSVPVNFGLSNETIDTDSVAPLYTLVFYDVPLVVVMGVYLLVNVGSAVLMAFFHWRRKQGVYFEDEEEEGEAHLHHA